MDGRIVIHNPGSATLRLRVEPWADEYEVPPGGRHTIFAKGPDPADIEVRVEAETLTVWGWPGSILNGDAEAN